MDIGKKNKIPRNVLVALTIAGIVLVYAVSQTVSWGQEETENSVTLKEGQNDQEVTDLDNLWSRSDLIEERSKALEEISGTEVNETELLSSELILAFMAMTMMEEDQSIEDLDASMFEGLSEDLAATLSQNQPIADLYTDEDVETIDSTSDNLQQYRLNLKEVIEKHYQQLGAEMEIFADALETGNQHFLDELNKPAEAYRAIAEELLNIKVPENLAEEHLMLINATAKTSLTIEKMQELLTNPVASVIGMNQYRIHGEEFINALEQMGQKAEENELF